MKRPLFSAAVIVLSGMICGIRESGIIIKAAAVTATALMLVFVVSGLSVSGSSLFVSEKEVCGKPGRVPGLNYVLLKRRLFISFVILLFAAGFLRGSMQSHIYNSAECREFYERYKPRNPGLFDYSLYLKSRDISDEEQYEQSKAETNAASSTETADEAPLDSMLAAVSGFCGSVFDKTLSEHDAGIYKAVILGDKSDMDENVRDLYQDAGIAHLLAVSGLHVSMIGAGLYGFLRRKFNAGHSAIIVSGVLFFYMLMTGASGSVIRAVIMLIMSIYAIVCGRNYCMTTAISVSAIIIMMYRPYMIFTSGFQLSFGAVASISLISRNIIRKTENLIENSDTTEKTGEIKGTKSGLGRKNFSELFEFKPLPCLKKSISRKNRLPKLLNAFIVSASIQLGTLPLIAYHFYKFPVYGILLNFIVVPLLAAVLASGIALVVVSGIFSLPGILIPSLAGASFVTAAAGTAVAIAAAPGHYVLKLYEALSTASLRLPYASVCIGRPGIPGIILYYLLLAIVISWFLRPRIIKRTGAYINLAAVAFSLICISGILRYRETRAFYVMAIDVGQGDCFLIKNGRHYILSDGGSSSRKNIGKNVMESVLLSRGISVLDAVCVSHADADHINGIKYLLSDESFPKIDALVLPEAARNDEAYDELRRLNKGKTVYPKAGELIAADGDMSLKCIYSGVDCEDRNRDSLVFLLKKGNFTMLFTGDTTADDEAVFADAAYLKEHGIIELEKENGLTVLKAAHHGSRTSNSEKLFASLRPKLVLISCGKNNRYGHPDEDVEERIREYDAKLFRTDISGAVILYLDGNRLKVHETLSD